MMELNCQQLIAMGKDVPTPFCLQVSTNRGAESVRVKKILRNIPGERITAIATWKESEVILKLFLQGARNKRFLFNELRAADLLRQRQIPTPDILHHSNTTDGQGTVLFIDQLKEALNLEQLFQRAQTDAEQESVLKAAMQALARCHQAGIWQDGFDMGQLLKARERIYVLSSSKLQTQNEPLPIAQRTRLIAEFLAQLPVVCDEKLPQLCEYYQGTSFAQDLLDPEQLRQEVRDKRRRRVELLAKGSFRKQEKVFQIEQSNYLLVYQADFPRKILERFQANPDALLAQGKMLKSGESSTVVELELLGKRFVLKRFSKKGFGHGLARSFSPSRANNCWRMARVFRALGVATPEPILFMEKRLLWSLRGDSYLLTEKIDAEHLLKQLEANPLLRQNPDSLVRGFQNLFSIMQQYQLSHGDLKATNFLLKNDKLIAIDLNAARYHANISSAARSLQNDWTDFMENWRNSSLANKFRVIQDALGFSGSKQKDEKAEP